MRCPDRLLGYFALMDLGQVNVGAWEAGVLEPDSTRPARPWSVPPSCPRVGAP
jgi:hypothetical protein